MSVPCDRSSKDTPVTVLVKPGVITPFRRLSHKREVCIMRDRAGRKVVAGTYIAPRMRRAGRPSLTGSLLNRAVVERFATDMRCAPRDTVMVRVTGSYVRPRR